MDDSLCGLGDDWVMLWGWTVVFGVFFFLHDLSIGVFGESWTSGVAQVMEY